jgi:hypothetical protein
MTEDAFFAAFFFPAAAALADIQARLAKREKILQEVE